MNCTLEDVAPYLTPELLETLLEMQDVFDDLDQMEEEFILETERQDQSEKPDEWELEEMQEEFADLEEIFEKLLEKQEHESEDSN